MLFMQHLPFCGLNQSCFLALAETVSERCSAMANHRINLVIFNNFRFLSLSPQLFLSLFQCDCSQQRVHRW